ncbi:MAG: hypothetical protein JSU70_22410 [Phycisphaerales bacterium]|nr:MAG: hypothetical protein JSU70_22410 [Phycisphaerales bacterium]
MSPQEALGITLIVIGAASPIIIVGLVYYLKKRLEHKQIMAAIEKGTPLSELRPPKPVPAGPAWIKYVALGVGAMIVGLGFLVSHQPGMVAAFVVLGIGAGWVVCGVLHRKYYLQGEHLNNNGGVKHEA